MKHYLAKLEETVRSRWTQKALCDYKGDDYTYADVARDIEEFRLFLAAAGIESGAKVELVDRPFDKTPKMSIKRYLYK